MEVASQSGKIFFALLNYQGVPNKTWAKLGSVYLEKQDFQIGYLQVGNYAKTGELGWEGKLATIP